MLKNFFEKDASDRVSAIKIRWRRLVHFFFKDTGIRFTILNGIKYYAYSDWVGTDRVLYGSFDTREVKFLSSCLKPGMICIDVGAHYGFYTLHMARLVKNAGKVIACEPSKKNRNKLERNVLTNSFNQVVILPSAISNKKGTASLFFNSYNTGGNTLLHQHSTCYKEQTKVDVETLDDVVSNLKISRLDFIKVDVEGNEYAVLGGAVETIRTFLPVILIELWEVYQKPWGEQLQSENSITEFLLRFGYLWYTISDTGTPVLVKKGEVRAQNNYLAIHPNKTILFE